MTVVHRSPFVSISRMGTCLPINSNASYNVLFKEKSDEESPARASFPLDGLKLNVSDSLDDPRPRPRGSTRWGACRTDEGESHPERTGVGAPGA